MMENNELRLIEKQIQREFRDVMPRRYWIFPTIPKIYSLSNCVCIEMPNYGSIAYNMKLSLLQKELNKKFIMDIHHFNGKRTFILKGKR